MGNVILYYYLLVAYLVLAYISSEASIAPAAPIIPNPSGTLNGAVNSVTIGSPTSVVIMAMYLPIVLVSQPSPVKSAGYVAVNEPSTGTVIGNCVPVYMHVLPLGVVTFMLVIPTSLSTLDENIRLIFSFGLIVSSPSTGSTALNVAKLDISSYSQLTSVSGSLEHIS
ncbi:hypothetical protein HRbin04_00690 [archaeon HR04]|nr:hypothetical protein HRbin04_00690 [archaeon HR04]